MKNLALSLISVVVLATGCNPKYYTPNTQNVPLISEKGETNLTLSGNPDQLEFQGAIGVTNSFAIKANGGFFMPSDLDNGNGGSGKFVELGGGYFKSLSEHLVFETYGIVGFGSFENHLPSTVEDYPQTKGDISANIIRYGIQPNFGYKSDHFSAAVSSRLVQLNYSEIDGDLIFDDVNQVNYLKTNNSNLLLEPALTLRGGFEKIKLQLQYGYSLNLTKSNFRQDHSFFTIGLNFNFK